MASYVGPKLRSAYLSRKHFPDWATPQALLSLREYSQQWEVQEETLSEHRSNEESCLELGGSTPQASLAE